MPAGGPRRIPHNRPTLGRAEERAAARAIRSGWIAPGPEARALEREFAARLGPGMGAVSVNSGSSALHLAVLALGIGPGDRVLVPSYACSALLNAVRYAGAVPVPCDVRPGDWTLDPARVLARAGRRARAVVETHTFGFPAPVEPFRRKGLAVIEDGAQSLGARLSGRPVGALGDVAVFSFGPTKPMTAGAGGVVAARRAAVLARVRDLRDYDRRPSYRVRYNYALDDIAAAVARAQLARLTGFLARRRRLAARYRARLSRLPGVSFQEASRGAEPSFYRFVVRTPLPAGKVVRALAARGISAIRPVEPRHLLHRYLGLPARDFPVAEELARSAVSLPLYPSLSDRDQRRVIAALEEVLG